MKKNTANQKWRVFAFNRNTGEPKTGDAANITAKIDIDYAGAGAITDTNPTETEDGYYLFDLTQAETNGDVLDIYPESSTADVSVLGVPGTLYTSVDVSSINGKKTDGTPAVEDRPILYLQQLNCQCSIGDEGAIHLVNSATGMLAGFGMYCCGVGAGQFNKGTDGHGQFNFSEASGQAGQYNVNQGGYGQRNLGFTAGQQNTGMLGVHNRGTVQDAVYNQGVRYGMIIEGESADILIVNGVVVDSSGNRLQVAVEPNRIGVGGEGFQFALSVSPADEPKVLAGESTDVQDEVILDATRRTTTYTPASIGSQWQLTIDYLQDDPSGNNPWIEFSSDNEAVATVNSEGLVQYVGDGTCTILGTSLATEDSDPLTIYIEITNTSSDGETTETVEYIADDFDAAKHLLVVYNSDSSESETLKDYYLANRPGVSAANVLGLAGLPDTTSTTSENVNSLILDPIYNWLVASEAAKPIRYIVVMRGVPSRQGSSGSVGYMLYDLLESRGYRSGNGYKGGESRFTRAQYQGATALTSWIDMGSYAASQAYIDKLKAAADSGGLQADGVTISGNTAGCSGDRWVLDDKRSEQYNHPFLALFQYVRSGLWIEGVPHDDVTYQPLWDGDLIATATDATFVGNWGVHTGVLQNGWGNNGSVSLDGNSGWFALMTIESFNGIYASSQGDPSEFFAASAFGGTDYASTPVCFVGHTAEPYASGVSSSHYAVRWARGWTAAEAAWAGRNTPHFIHVGDPLVTR